MRNLIVARAVAGVLATAGAVGAANADTLTVYVSGASAQRTFYQRDIGGICSGTFGTAGVATQSSAVPDIALSTCTIQATGTRGSAIPIPSGLSTGDVITMQYAAELGSVWGIAPFISTNAAFAGRRFLDPAFCSGSTCTVTGYCRYTDTATSGLTGKIIPDMGVTDMEPTLWGAQNPDNWPAEGAGGPTYPILAPQPTKGTISGIPGFTRINGQVFALYVNATNPGTADLTNLSVNSARAILTGAYTTWDQVPELANSSGASGVNIVVCRRDHGSGTEVASSVAFTGKECGVAGNSIVSQGNGSLGQNTNNLFSPINGQPNPAENFSTADMAGCLTAAAYNTGATPAAPIGIRSINVGGLSGARALALNGIEANAHNAASGAYPYAFDTFAKNNSVAASASAKEAALVAGLISDAQNPSRVGAEPGSVAASGFWAAGSANAQVQYNLDNGAVSLTSDWNINSGKAARELFNTNGNSCAGRNNDNNP